MFVLLVAGSRTFDNASLLYNKLDFYLQGREEVLIIHGGAKGADSLVDKYAKDRNYKTKVFLPNWERYGKKAGILRNIEMFEYISKLQNNGCVVFWDGKSRGTANGIKLAQKYKTPLRVVRF